ncbi:hypothetical protein [Cobetia marina]|uniref:hypothetical protein n=1 Tax=Cobetia marina TaxID=28258 RepID=UPI0012F49617|nr:hypothetical protein [Cobetia marina]
MLGKLLFLLALLSILVLYKNSFFRICILIYAYPLWIMYGLMLGDEPTRIISATGYYYYAEYLKEAVLTAIASFVAFLIPLWKVRNEEYSFPTIRVSKTTNIAVFSLFIFSICAAYPSVFYLSDSRFGSMGSLVVIFFATWMITVGNSNESTSKLQFAVALSVVAFAIIRGERVDFILMLCLMLFYYFKTSRINLLYLSVPLISIFALGMYGGLSRGGESLNISSLIEEIVANLSSLGTAVDVVHVYLSSVWYVNAIGYTLEPIINILMSVFPSNNYGGASSEYNYVWILRDYINNVGGGMFYTAFMLAAGPILTVVSGYIYGYLLKKMFLLKTKYGIVFIMFFIMQLRLQWYGPNYFGSIVLFSIIFVVFIKLLKNIGVYIEAKE